MCLSPVSSTTSAVPCKRHVFAASSVTPRKEKKLEIPSMFAAAVPVKVSAKDLWKAALAAPALPGQCGGMRAVAAERSSTSKTVDTQASVKAYRAPAGHIRS